jgi:hypothetical protein
MVGRLGRQAWRMVDWLGRPAWVTVGEESRQHWRLLAVGWSLALLCGWAGWSALWLVPYMVGSMAHAPSTGGAVHQCPY